MFSRNLDSTLKEFLQSRQPIRYAHLIKFERPSKNPNYGNLDASRFLYLTDGSINRTFDDGSMGPSGPNGPQVYLANKVISVPPIQEFSEARAYSIEIELDGSQIGAVTSTTGSITSNILTTTDSLVGKGFMEGDLIQINDQFVVIEKFPTEFTVKLKEAENIPSQPLLISQSSQEIVNILLDKNSEGYSSMLGRLVYIYKAFYDSKDNFKGSVLIYKGIVADGSLGDSESSISVKWKLNNHWADFSEVNGRLTSDEVHRALDNNGIPQPTLSKKPDYAFDKGFIHSDTSVNVLAEYSVQVEKQKIKVSSGFFGIGAKVKIKKYFETEQRQSNLEINLTSKYLPVVYGVRLVEPSVCFADTLLNNPSIVYSVQTLCEGPIGGIYNIILEDKSLLCLSQADNQERGAEVIPEEDAVNSTVCYGRADRGDVISGAIIDASGESNYYSSTLDYLQYINLENIGMYQVYYDTIGDSPDPGVNNGVGLTHGSTLKITRPSVITMNVFCGLSGQEADPTLVSEAKSENFKIQNAYWGKDSSEYWGPNHRLLDTAYVTFKNVISEGSTGIPDTKFVVKGKFVNCFNYDNSFIHDESKVSEDIANFEQGMVVQIYDYSDTLLGTAKIQRIGKFLSRKGEMQDRIFFSGRLPLGYINGVPTITKFYAKFGTNTYSMLTFNSESYSGTVAKRLESPVTSIGATGDTVTITTGSSILSNYSNPFFNGRSVFNMTRLEY